MASGVSSGGSGFSQPGQMYVQGKIVFFKKIACDAGCPLTRAAVSRATAQRVLDGLRTKGALKSETTPMDDAISDLNAVEAEHIAQFLTRRFDIS